jgi:hypothetical protein
LEAEKPVGKRTHTGLLLLFIYFIPVVTLISFLDSIFLLLLGSSQLVSFFWFFVPLSFYSFVGNFAPFFEIGIGAYLDGRGRTQWIAPLLFFDFLYNLPICTKALLDIVLGKVLRRRQNWAKTSHLGGETTISPSAIKLEGSP